MTDVGYGEEQTATVSEEDIAAAEAYVRWENEELARWASCAPTCALSRARSRAARWYPSIWTTTPARRGRRENAAARLRGGGHHRRAHPLCRLHAAACRVGDSAMPAAAISCRHVGASDADRQRRGWLVYMLVRTRGVGSRCPRCGTALRMGFGLLPRLRRAGAPFLPRLRPCRRGWLEGLPLLRPGTAQTGGGGPERPVTARPSGGRISPQHFHPAKTPENRVVFGVFCIFAAGNIHLRQKNFQKGVDKRRKWLYHCINRLREKSTRNGVLPRESRAVGSRQGGVRRMGFRGRS